LSSWPSTKSLKGFREYYKDIDIERFGRLNPAAKSPPILMWILGPVWTLWRREEVEMRKSNGPSPGSIWYVFWRVEKSIQRVQ